MGFQSQGHSKLHPNRFAASDRPSVDSGRFPARQGLYESLGFLIASMSESVADFDVAHCSLGIDGECDYDTAFDVSYGGFFGVTQMLGEKVGELFLTAGELCVLYIGAIFAEPLGIQMIEHNCE